MVAQLVSDHCVHLFSVAIKRPAMQRAPVAGPRAKRMKIPQKVLEADQDGAMDMTVMARYVRDLMRQHKFDRDAWLTVADTLNDHANLLDAARNNLEQVNDELLQVNDQVATVVDGANALHKAQEQQARQQTLEAVERVTTGVNLVDTNLRFTISELQKEFKAERVDGRELVSVLENKFALLETKLNTLAEQSVRSQEHISRVDAACVLQSPTPGQAQGTAPPPGAAPQGAAPQAAPQGAAPQAGQPKIPLIQSQTHYNIATPQRPAAWPETRGLAQSCGPEGLRTAPSGVVSAPQAAHAASTGGHVGMNAGDVYGGAYGMTHGGAYGMYCGPNPYGGGGPGGPGGYGGGHQGPGAAGIYGGHPGGNGGAYGGHPGGGHPGGGHPGGGHPGGGSFGGRRLFSDSKVFETKVAMDAARQYDGGKSGIS